MNPFLGLITLLLPELACRLHRCYQLVEQGERSRMTPYVVDIYERGAAAKWPRSTYREVARPTVVVCNLVSRRNHSAQAAAPYCSAVRGTYRNAITVSGKLTTAPVPLIFDKSSSLFENLNLEWFRHDNSSTSNSMRDATSSRWRDLTNSFIKNMLPIRQKRTPSKERSHRGLSGLDVRVTFRRFWRTNHVLVAPSLGIGNCRLDSRVAGGRGFDHTFIWGGFTPARVCCGTRCLSNGRARHHEQEKNQQGYSRSKQRC